MQLAVPQRVIATAWPWSATRRATAGKRRTCSPTMKNAAGTGGRPTSRESARWRRCWGRRRTSGRRCVRPRDPRPMAGPKSGLFGSYVPYAQAPSAAPDVTKGSQAMMGGKENTGAEIQKPPGRRDRPPGGPYTSVTRSRGLLPRSSSRRRRLTDSSLGRANRSSGFHPQAAWPGRKVHRCGCWGQIGSRTDFRTARRGTASTWLGHATGPSYPTRRGSSRSPAALSLVLHRRPPRNFRSDPS